MNVTIGVRDSAAPLHLEVDCSADEILRKARQSAINNEPLEITGADGTVIFVPSEALGYVKIAKEEQHRMGFGFV